MSKAPRSDPEEATGRPALHDAHLTESELRPRVAGYRLLSMVGRGGMSEVYRALDERLERIVALKVLAPQLADSQSFRARFLRESRVAAQLDHPSIVPVYEAGNDGDVLFISMRLIEGRDLHAILEEDGRLTIRETLTLLRPAAEALDHAHANGVVHRDVKPGNILVEDGGETPRVFLSDFGLTKVSSVSRYTETGELVGSIAYMAPEQIEGRDVDGRADVYALGCVAYQCLTGVSPFDRDSEAAVLWAHMNGETPSIRKEQPGLSKRVDAAVAGALAPRPEERYSTCAELIQALEDSRAGRSVPHLARAAARSRTARRLRRRTGAFVTGFSRAVRLMVGALLIAGIAIPGGLVVARSTGLIGGDGDTPREPATASAPEASGRQKRMPPMEREGSDRGQREPDAQTGQNRESGRDTDLASAKGTRADHDLGTTAEEIVDEGAPDVVTPVRSQPPPRRLELAYNATDNTAIAANQNCADVRNAGCLTIETREDERWLDLAIDDGTGSVIVGWIRQDRNRDGHPEGEWTKVCGATDEPIRITPGALINILLDDRDCPNENTVVPTEGTLLFTLYTKENM